MEICMLAIVIVAFGQLLRMLSQKSLCSIEWLEDRDKLTKNLERASTVLGWLVISFGRLLLYVSFIHAKGYTFLLFIIALVELLYSIYISVSIKRIRILRAVLQDVINAALIAVYVYRLIGAVASLIFII